MSNVKQLYGSDESHNIGESSIQVLKKGKVTELESSKVQAPSVSNKSTVGKDMSKSHRSADSHSMDVNNMLRVLYNERVKAVNMLMTTGFDNNDTIIQITRNILNSMLPSIKKGVNVKTIAAAITPWMAIMSVIPEIHNSIKLDVYDKMSAYAKAISEQDSKYKAFYTKCLSMKKDDRMPLCAETAALSEIAIDMKYYTDIRVAGLSDVDKAKINSKYESDKANLQCIIADNNIEKYDWREQNHKIVISFIMTNPVYKRMFSYVFDNHAVNLDVIESSLTTYLNPDGKQMSTYVYRIPLSGLVYADDGNSFHYRFGSRPTYTPNVYDDMLFETMKDHYGPVSKAEKSDDKSYLKTDEYKKALLKFHEIKAMMSDDNYTEKQIEEVIESSNYRCEMYYHTEVPEGISEWLKEHPEDAKPEEQSVSVESEVEKPREHIKINKSSSDKEEWIVSPSDLTYVSTLKMQNGMQRKQPFAETMSVNDYVVMATLMNELACAIDAHDHEYGLHATIERLKQSPDDIVKKFLKEYASREMGEACRMRYDLINMMYKTDAPVLNQQNTLVATRQLYDVINAGDIGGKLHGKSACYKGCWVDAKSGITDTVISGNVMILMHSKVKNSKIIGNGLIVNSEIDKCELSGDFDEYAMRNQMNENQRSPVHLLEMSNVKSKFEMTVKTGIDRIKSHAYEYLNMTVDEYVAVWHGKNHAKNVLNKNAAIKFAKAITLKESKKEPVKSNVQVGKSFEKVDTSTNTSTGKLIGSSKKLM